MTTKILGDIGENSVAEFLKKRGYTICATQFSCKYGEVDVIAQKDDVVAFIEVKTRRVAYFPIASVVNYGKQRKIIAAAQYYIVSKRIADKVFRFDVATVIINGADAAIDYIEDAFRKR